MKKRMRDENGVAMVTAILVSAIVVLLSVSAVSVAIHNTDASGYDKRRLISIDAAEAGIDFYYMLLGSTSFTSLPTKSLPTGYSINSSTCVLTGTTSSSPSSTFTVTPTFYPTSAATNPQQCPLAMLATNSTGPWYVELKSVGVVAAQTAPQRIMRSRARLSTSGSGLVFPSAAMIGATSVDLSANIQVFGNGANNADVYTDGNLVVSTQSNIKGNMYVQGTATVANGNFQLTGDLWAKSWVAVSGGVIGGAVVSSGTTTTTCAGGASPATAPICVSGNTSIYGGAKSGGAISVKSPASLFGTQSANTPGIGDPPRQTYPTYTFTAGDWPGYVTHTSCANALTAISGWATGNLYIRLTGGGTCDLTVSKSMPGNLAILTDGGLRMVTPTKFTNGDGTGATHTVYFFTGMPGGTIETSANCSSGGNFTAQANSGIGGNLKVVIFTPKSCTTTISSNGFNGTGQIFSGTIKFSSNATFTYAPITLPVESVAVSPGYLVDPVYRREAAS